MHYFANKEKTAANIPELIKFFGLFAVFNAGIICTNIVFASVA